MREPGEDETRTSHRGPPWARGDWHGGGRPPWWPEDEPFPPRGPYGWRRMRSRFVRRVALGFGFFIVALFAFSALVGALFSRGFHTQRHHGFGPLIGLL